MLWSGRVFLKPNHPYQTNRELVLDMKRNGNTILNSRLIGYMVYIVIHNDYTQSPLIGRLIKL